MSEYEAMWKELGLDLEGHDNLLKTLGGFYKDIYLSQKNRPKETSYLDSVLSEIHGLRIKELVEAREQGRKVVGAFCVFMPEEIVLAANGISVGLCAGAEIGKEEAERILPRNTCALIKAFFGFKLAKLCPYVEVCDLIVGETTCDGKKKAYELFAEYAPMYVMEIPQRKEAVDREMWKAEVIRFKEKIEELSGKTIAAENLGSAIKTVNDRRRVLQRLNSLRKAIPTPISGRDVILANQIAFYDNPERFTESMAKICDELEERIKNNEGIVEQGTPRLMFSGCPMAAPNWKLPFVVETSGAVIIGEESCVGTRNTRDLVNESGDTVEEMIENIVDRYMQINCAVFTPNDKRVEQIVEMAKDLNVDGVIHYALQFCQPYAIESYRVEQALEKEGIPLLKIETDYSMEDMEVLKNRVDAFVGTLE